MATFHLARFSAAYTPDDTEEEIDLVRPQDLLTAPPERTWEHTSAQFDLIGRAYGLDLPTGNARLTLRFEVARRAPGVALLERRLRLLELAANLHRRGLLTLCEAWHENAPLLITRWQCTVAACTVRRLTSDDAPSVPGAWGAASIELILTNPENN